MILGQLFNVALLYCEQRPDTVLPADSFELVLIAYTLRDQLHCQRFERDPTEPFNSQKDWLNNRQAIAYLAIERQTPDEQIEFPPPIGQKPEDYLFITAATRNDMKVACYSLLGELDRDSRLTLQPCLRSCRLRRRTTSNLLDSKPRAIFPTDDTLPMKFAS